jgi:hypothetical protein
VPKGEALTLVNIERQSASVRRLPRVWYRPPPTPPISVRATAEAGGKLPVGCPGGMTAPWWSR